MDTVKVKVIICNYYYIFVLPVETIGGSLWRRGEAGLFYATIGDDSKACI